MSEPDLIAAARAAAVTLGVLDAAGTADAIAARLGVAPRRLGWLLDLLAADGLLVRDRDGYRAAGPRGGDMGAPGGALVAQVIRRDAPLDLLDVAGNVAAARLSCHDGLTRVPPALVARLAALVGDGTLLDAGCGDGALAEAVLAAEPRARARLVDRDVRHVRRLASERVEVVAAELATLDAPPARVVLLSNVLHTSTAAAAIVQRARSLVEPGGTLMIREVALDADRGSPRFGLAFGLSLLVFGDVELPTAAQLHAWVGSVRRSERIDEAIVIEASRWASNERRMRRSA